MATVTVTLPRMLADLVGGRRHIEVAGDTVDGLLAALTALHPELRVHLFDETGAIRAHVSCFHNDATISDPTTPIAEGDTVVILQAVSGG